jgi:hypothetical protein
MPYVVTFYFYLLQFDAIHRAPSSTNLTSCRG